mmetsp:Transcript_9937/g.19820  ORF Transcript_9937/g.19820 Transcript_9937/m.19820 type:complete len:106 (-) Transcript_9937:1522-1839(-)
MLSAILLRLSLDILSIGSSYPPLTPPNRHLMIFSVFIPFGRSPPPPDAPCTSSFPLLRSSSISITFLSTSSTLCTHPCLPPSQGVVVAANLELRGSVVVFVLVVD